MTLTNADALGEFGLTFVPVGVYTVRIEASGFKVLESSGLELTAGQTVRSRFSLELGQTTERIELTSEAPQVNAVSAEQRQGAALATPNNSVPPQVNAVSAEQRQGIVTQEVRELPLSRRSIDAVLGVGRECRCGRVSRSIDLFRWPRIWQR